MPSASSQSPCGDEAGDRCAAVPRGGRRALRSRRARSGPARRAGRTDRAMRVPAPPAACRPAPGSLVAVIDDQSDAALLVRCAAIASTASSRAGEVSTISPSRSKAKPAGCKHDPPLDARRRTGGSASASKNSLATSEQRPAAEARRWSSCHWRPARARACASRSTGLVSTKCDFAVANPDARITRSASAASVPRPGPKLDIDGIRRRARTLPAIGERGADQLAEHLADFGRGGEVAAPRRTGRGSRNNKRCRRPYRPRRVIGAVASDALAQRPLERRQATLAVPAVGSTRTRGALWR